MQKKKMKLKKHFATFLSLETFQLGEGAGSPLTTPMLSSKLSLYIRVWSFALLLLYDSDSQKDNASQKYHLNLFNLVLLDNTIQLVWLVALKQGSFLELVGVSKLEGC